MHKHGDPQDDGGRYERATRAAGTSASSCLVALAGVLTLVVLLSALLVLF
jgi:hypothetical protein